MNKMVRKITSLGLCAAVCLGGMYATPARAASEGQGEQKVDAVSQEAFKDETVYVLTGADGSVQKVIVSDWIRNEAESDTLLDQSTLADIENVKGDEGYSVDEDGMTVWDAQGGDIYYRGTSEEALPVDMSVSYLLDGEEISAEELAGKSGKVTIRFTYTNRQYETVEIDGGKEKIYVPFAMLTGMLLDNDVFRNVEISNGVLVNDGDRTLAAGWAFPGMQENLALDESSFAVPDYIEITADATDFTFGMTVTLATNGLFSALDTEKIGSEGDVNDFLSEIADAVAQLTDGSSALYDGLCTLLDKSGELVSGIDRLAEGAEALKEGAGSLDGGAEQLQQGLATLTDGLNTLTGSSAELTDGAAQVFNTLLATATQQIRAAGLSVSDLTIDGYADTLSGLIASLDESAVYSQAQSKVRSAVEEKRPEIVDAVTAAVREGVAQQVTEAVQAQVTANVSEAVAEQVTEQVILAATGLDKATYEAAVAAEEITAEQQEQISAAVAEQLASEQVQATVAATAEATMQSEEIQATIAASTEEQMQSEAVQTMISEQTNAQVEQAISDNMQSDSVRSQIASASAGAKSLIEVKTSLDSYNAFYLGLRAYTDGVGSAASGSAQLFEGAGTLKDGTAQLYSGAETLCDGVEQMQSGAPALVDGITQLRDGAKELSDGVKEFGEQGVEKLAQLTGDDLAATIARLKATVDVSKEYRSFSGVADEMGGRVKFIYRTDEIN